MASLEEFLRNYYHQQIQELATEQGKNLTIDFKDIVSFDPDLADKLIQEPDKTIQELEKALRLYDVVDSSASLRRAKIQITNAHECKVKLRIIGTEHLNQFVSVEGIVCRVSDVSTGIIEGAFRCMRCGHITFISQPSLVVGRFIEPLRCDDENCDRKGPFELVTKESKLIDIQRVQIQESPECLSRSTQARTLLILLQGELINHKLVCGDRIIINGVLKGVRKDKAPEFTYFIEANYLERVSIDHSDIEIIGDDEKQILELSKKENLLDFLSGNIAPSVLGYEAEKKAIVLQQFEGNENIMPDGSLRRGSIHIALIGDPGVAKSVLLDIASKNALRGVFVTGSDSTKAGLTATAVKDEITGKWTLEAGALVLANGGLLALDELDKLDPEDRHALNETMEQQTISIAKAGVTMRLPAKTSILAAANPKSGRFDLMQPILEQVDLSAALASRFDLIFVMIDRPNPDNDSRLAKFILQGRDKKNNEDFEADLFRKYIAYSKRVRPSLTDETRQILHDEYVKLRELSGEGRVSITPRQLESMKRLSEAHARMRLSNSVEVIDTQVAIDLMQASLRQAFIDPETGKFDVDVIAVGITKCRVTRHLS